MTHPLTDELIEDLAQFEPDLNVFLKFNRSYDMRAAADWQLERDVEFFKKILVDSLRISTDTAALMAQEFKKAMRPQRYD